MSNTPQPEIAAFGDFVSSHNKSQIRPKKGYNTAQATKTDRPTPHIPTIHPTTPNCEKANGGIDKEGMEAVVVGEKEARKKKSPWHFFARPV